ncbi:BgTH12-02141 [Blumeria graminis f. sp. triticale]|uniref:Crossover junction endonuclease MUS81 n=1 Tax=Blumeria graminis f. sp. triticale TaxID=1689686 RepID=A0A9W4DL64_BLUGR|nr:BgTH12-02141 [Blumeria graminis f. sp. triticale]
MSSIMTECANPLLLRWVAEWLEEARTRNSKSVQIYKKAYDSLLANPISFSHPSEAKQLTGIGDTMCARLTAKMERYCEENSLPKPKQAVIHKQHKRNSDVESQGRIESTTPPRKKPRKPKVYVPQYRSGGYGLILALATLRDEPPSYITKQDAISLAQPHCDASYVIPSDSTKLYTAWKSMNMLIEKQLVHEMKGGITKYALTPLGWKCAHGIQKSLHSDMSAEVNLSSAKQGFSVEDSSILADTSQNDLFGNTCPIAVPDVVPNGQEVTCNSSLPSFTPIVIEPKSFTVEMIMDTREVRSRRDRDFIEDELIKREAKPIKRVMELGDFTWIAKMNDPNLLSSLGVEGDEIVLDYIVERKRLDDLITSIKDKRFHEQKFRLGRSGIKNVIYLVENNPVPPDVYSKMEAAVKSAIAGVQVVNGYFFKKTQGIEETLDYLASMSKALQKKYEKEPLHIIPTSVLSTTTYLPLITQKRKTEPGIDYHITYPAFACLMSKTDILTLRDLYLKMLMCTRGVTGEKALEIQKRWRTPFELTDAYRQIDEEETSIEEAKKKKANLVSGSMHNLFGRRKVASTLSATISEVWGQL